MQGNTRAHGQARKRTQKQQQHSREREKQPTVLPHRLRFISHVVSFGPPRRFKRFAVYWRWCQCGTGASDGPFCVERSLQQRYRITWMGPHCASLTGSDEAVSGDSPIATLCATRRPPPWSRGRRSAPTEASWSHRLQLVAACGRRVAAAPRFPTAPLGAQRSTSWWPDPAQDDQLATIRPRSGRRGGGHQANSCPNGEHLDSMNLLTALRPTVDRPFMPGTCSGPTLVARYRTA